MTNLTPDPAVCAAGRTAFFEGRWKNPCPLDPLHVIVSPALEVHLCDDHFKQVNTAGLVTDPYISREGAEHLKHGRGRS